MFVRIHNSEIISDELLHLTRCYDGLGDYRFGQLVNYSLQDPDRVIRKCGDIEGDVRLISRFCKDADEECLDSPQPRTFVLRRLFTELSPPWSIVRLLQLNLIRSGQVQERYIGEFRLPCVRLPISISSSKSSSIPGHAITGRFTLSFPTSGRAIFNLRNQFNFYCWNTNVHTTTLRRLIYVDVRGLEGANTGFIETSLCFYSACKGGRFSWSSE
jgi:hypothetical protein